MCDTLTNQQVEKIQNRLVKSERTLALARRHHGGMLRHLNGLTKALDNGTLNEITTNAIDD